VRKAGEERKETQKGADTPQNPNLTSSRRGKKTGGNIPPQKERRVVEEGGSSKMGPKELAETTLIAASKIIVHIGKQKEGSQNGISKKKWGVLLR